MAKIPGSNPGGPNFRKKKKFKMCPNIGTGSETFEKVDTSFKDYDGPFFPNGVDRLNDVRSKIIAYYRVLFRIMKIFSNTPQRSAPPFSRGEMHRIPSSGGVQGWVF